MRLPSMIIGLGLAASIAAAQAAPAQIAGDWHGVISLPQGRSLPIILHVVVEGDRIKATLDSPAQNGFGLPVQEASLDGESLNLALPKLSARYVATLHEQAQILDGRWFQGPASLPLILHHGTQAVASRPQIPHPPFPYRSLEVAFDNPAGPSHLAGTLTLPEGKGPFPAVLLITGSGLQDRDETILGHKPFLLWADTLTRKGIAVLRVDDRQRGGSTGPVTSATTKDFAGDVEAGLRFLRNNPEIDPKRVGLMGHSEGGEIAAMIAARDDTLGFIVLLEAPPVPGRQIMLAQRDWAMKQRKIPQAIARESDLDFVSILDALTPDQTQQAADKAADAVWNRRKDMTTGLPPEFRVLTTPAIRFMDRYDPSSDLSRVRCPVLAVVGERDRQVPPDIALPALRKALGGNKQARIIELPGLNHLLQKATTGDSGEYGTIEEDIDPGALAVVTDWIRSQTGK